jgi:hypothetical protein
MIDHCGGGSKPKLHLEWEKLRAVAANYRGLQISLPTDDKKYSVPLQGYEKFQMDA